MNKYEIILYWSDEYQAFIAEVPELPGCAADCNGSRSIAPMTAELVLLGAGIYRACLPRADPLKVVLGVKGPLRRAYRRAPDSSGPLWSFG